MYATYGNWPCYNLQLNATLYGKKNLSLNENKWFWEKCGGIKFKGYLGMKFGKKTWNQLAFEKLTAKIWLKSNGMVGETEHQNH